MANGFPVTTTTTQLSEQAKALLDGKHFAHLATLQPDGSPQLSITWVDRDGDDILISTVQGRRKQLNIKRDPRVSVVVSSCDAPYNYIEVRGRATLTTEGGRELINKLSHRYQGTDYGDDGPNDVRVTVRVTPMRIIDHL